MPEHEVELMDVGIHVNLGIHQGSLLPLYRSGRFAGDIV